MNRVIKPSDPSATHRGQSARSSAGPAQTRAPADSAAGGTSRSGESVRETLDSIVVAFILAFVFRAFVVEAFVIPTGSMAPTLYGQHGSVTCEDCAYSFVYGLTDPNSAPPRFKRTDPAVCPNCSHVSTNLYYNDFDNRSQAGDRILVLKWPLDLGIPSMGVHRWDVVVFKDPKDGTTNFIKRLIGTPNEVLMILDGDIYTVPLDKLSDDTRAALHAFLEQKVAYQLGKLPPADIEPLPKPALDDIYANVTLTQKTPVAQTSLWFNVYDDDFRPRHLDAGQPHWTPVRNDSNWDTSKRSMIFAGGAEVPDAIELADHRPYDRYGYNLKPPRYQYRFPVEDMRVHLVLYPKAPDARIGMRLGKLGRVFEATLDADGTVHLSCSDDQGQPIPGWETPLTARLEAPLRLDTPVELSFENVDYQVALYVDGRKVIATTPDRFAPDVPALVSRMKQKDRYVRRGQRDPGAYLPPAIVGQGGSFEIRHVVTERDVYYRAQGPNAGPVPSRDPGVFRRLGYWAAPANPIMLREGEYFCLGDNSPASQDSRLWTRVGPHLVERGDRYQIGTVPADQMIGQAFFVYWPSGLRLAKWLPGIGNWGIIPNVGDMRWIR